MPTITKEMLYEKMDEIETVIKEAREILMAAVQQGLFVKETKRATGSD